MLTPSQVKLSAEPKPLRLERIDGGLNVRDIEIQLNNNQSPYMVNLNADDRGALTKRWGQRYVYPTSLGEGSVHAVYPSYKGKKVLHHGTKLYTQEGSNQPVEIYSGLNNAKGAFFLFADKLYYLNAGKYIVYDGNTVQDVVGYIPTVTLARKPDGSASESYEDLNLLSAGFKDSFSSDGSTTYKLSRTGLDATPVVAVVNNETKTEGVHFTVNRTTGEVDFSGGSNPLGAIPAGSPNNVVITAYKTVSGAADKIKKCKYAILFGGGANDTRVFITGNPDYKNSHFYCGLGDPTYWPESGQVAVGSEDEASVGFAPYYNNLVLFKERSIYLITAQYNDTIEKMLFPVQPLSSDIGCDMPYSIVSVDNMPIFANTIDGVHIIRSTIIESEKNVEPISGNINGASFRPGLLDEPIEDLKEATAIAHQGKYYLCVGSKCWVWDFELSPYAKERNLTWFFYTNIHANQWFTIGQDLYYAHRDQGVLVSTQAPYNDFGEPILGVWRSKLFDFNLVEWLKNVPEIWLRTRSGEGSTLIIKYYNENGEVITQETVPASETASFNWSTFAWDKFTWKVNRFAPTIPLKPRIKKKMYFQIEIMNNGYNENLSILGLTIRYLLAKKVK